MRIEALYRKIDNKVVTIQKTQSSSKDQNKIQELYQIIKLNIIKCKNLIQLKLLLKEFSVVKIEYCLYYS